jgi:hopene-associated glycosyltransferase HpnB
MVIYPDGILAMSAVLLGFLPLAVWLYLLLGRSRFWQLRERDDEAALPRPARWPSVVAVVPARNEADVIQKSISSLLAQDYLGDFRVILVDDQSEDGTASLLRALNFEKLIILPGTARPSGWTGKLWAMHQGVAMADEFAPDFLLFTDADIAHAPDNLSRLVARAELDDKVLVSLMARLSCASAAEYFLIPAFVFFFDMLFPFGAVNDPRNKLAAAAGGCMLARRSALIVAGGIEAIHYDIIDDCALARLMKAQGPIWLGLSDRAVSLRPYAGFSEIRRMVSRSAYAQLGYSPLQLAGTLLGLLLVYIAPVAMALFGSGLPQIAGWAAWIVMALMFQPILLFYRLSPFWGLALPLIGAVYAGFTLDSAIQHWQGKGGMWKGRAQAETKS